jgi:hypothetical protein
VSTPSLLPFLVHDLQGKQDLAESPLLREEQAVNHRLPIDFDLPDIAMQVINVTVTSASVTNLFHCGSDCRGIRIGKLVQELTNRLAPSCAPIKAPFPAVAFRLVPDWFIGCHRRNPTTRQLSGRHLAAGLHRL